MKRNLPLIANLPSIRFGTAAESHRRFMAAASWLQPLQDLAAQDKQNEAHAAWLKATFGGEAT